MIKPERYFCPICKDRDLEQKKKWSKIYYSSLEGLLLHLKRYGDIQEGFSSAVAISHRKLYVEVKEKGNYEDLYKRIGFCNICKVNCHSRKNFLVHIRGKRHEKRNRVYQENLRLERKKKMEEEEKKKNLEEIRIEFEESYCIKGSKIPLQGHINTVCSSLIFTFSNGEVTSLLVTSGRDNTIIFWDFESCQVLEMVYLAHDSYGHSRNSRTIEHILLKWDDEHFICSNRFEKASLIKYTAKSVRPYYIENRIIDDVFEKGRISEMIRVSDDMIVLFCKIQKIDDPKPVIRFEIGLFSYSQEQIVRKFEFPDCRINWMNKIVPSKIHKNCVYLPQKKYLGGRREENMGIIIINPIILINWETGKEIMFFNNIRGGNFYSTAVECFVHEPSGKEILISSNVRRTTITQGYRFGKTVFTTHITFYVSERITYTTPGSKNEKFVKVVIKPLPEVVTTDLEFYSILVVKKKYLLLGSGSGGWLELYKLCIFLSPSHDNTSNVENIEVRRLKKMKILRREFGIINVMKLMITDDPKRCFTITNNNNTDDLNCAYLSMFCLCTNEVHILKLEGRGLMIGEDTKNWKSDVMERTVFLKEMFLSSCFVKVYEKIRITKIWYILPNEEGVSLRPLMYLSFSNVANYRN